MARGSGRTTSCNVQSSVGESADENSEIFSLEDDEMRTSVPRYTDGGRDMIKFQRAFAERFGFLIDQEIWLNTKDSYRWLTHMKRRAGNIWISD